VAEPRHSSIEFRSREGGAFPNSRAPRVPHERVVTSRRVAWSSQGRPVATRAIFAILGVHLTQVAPRSCSLPLGPRLATVSRDHAGRVFEKPSATDEAVRSGFPGARPSGGARWTDARCCAQFRRGRSAIATATYSGYLSQVHSQYAHYEDPK